MDPHTRERSLEQLRCAYVDGRLLEVVKAFGSARMFLEGYVEAGLDQGHFTPEEYVLAKHTWARAIRAEILDDLFAGREPRYEQLVLEELVNDGHLSYQEMDKIRYKRALCVIEEHGPYGLFALERGAIGRWMNHLFALPIKMRIARQHSPVFRNNAEVIRRGILDENITFIDVMRVSQDYFLRVCVELLEQIKKEGYRISTMDRCLLGYAYEVGLMNDDS